MRIIFRQISITLLILFLAINAVLGITFLLFRLENIQLLITSKFFNIYYLGVIGIIILITGLVGGMISAQLWRQHMQYIKRQLDHLYQGQTLIDEDYKDLKQIDKKIQAIQNNIVAQVKHAQQYATERANYR